MFIRINALDLDGQYHTSGIKRTAGECDSKEKNLVIFPNPAPANNSSFTVRSDRPFNGSYKISLLDMSGKLVRKNTLALVNTNQFEFNHSSSLPAAQYLVVIQQENSEEVLTLTWQKR